MTNDILIQSREIEIFLEEVFVKSGLEREDASFLGKTIVQTNLWGIDSHGVIRTSIYVKRFQSRAVNRHPQMRFLRGSRALEVLDGDNGLGFFVGRAAMTRAVELAKEYNVGIVAAINSNHFGAASVYSRMALERGMVGFSTTNAVAYMVAPGGSQPIIGNNPFSVAIPTFGSFPVVLDIALSTVAMGKILLARERGDKIPMDWATDSEGHPTDDPEKAVKGFFLPIGGHKGYALAIIIDILCGVVTGGAFLDQLKGMYKHPADPGHTCHLMAAINISALIGEDEMRNRMESYGRIIKEARMLKPGNELLLPGEIEYRTSLEREKKGIPLPPSLYEELIALGKQLGVKAALSYK